MGASFILNCFVESVAALTRNYGKTNQFPHQELLFKQLTGLVVTDFEDPMRARRMAKKRFDV